MTSDGDLQNDPQDIPSLVARLEEGYDVVCGWRKHRKDPWLTRRLPSMMANKLISLATGIRLNDYGCSLKAFRSDVVKRLRLYGEMHRFLPAIASEMGVRIDEVVVNHRVRKHGRSKYGLGRTVRVLLDLITVKFLLSYSTRPLQMFGMIGLIVGGLGGLILARLAYLRLFAYQSIGDRPLLLLGVLLAFIGVQFITIGLLAELQARTYHESQDKAIYVVRRRPRRLTVSRPHDPGITVIQQELLDERPADHTIQNRCSIQSVTNDDGLSSGGRRWGIVGHAEG